MPAPAAYEEEWTQEPRPAVLLKRKRRTSAGFSYLRNQLLHSNTSMSSSAKSLLRNLLRENDIEVTGREDEEDDVLTEVPMRAKTIKTVDETMSDETILQLAQKGQLCFLGSLLKVVDESQGSVSTRHCIKKCCLAIPPGKVPALMDAKEMVMAGLHFLSSEIDMDGTDSLPSLPLIRPVQMIGDLEKRFYEKVGDWKLQDVMDKVSALENIFLSDCSKYKLMGREKFCPRLERGEQLLLLKGNPPAAATGKVKKVTVTQRKKKAPEAKTLPSKPLEDPVAHEAARIMSETSAANPLGPDFSAPDY